MKVFRIANKKYASNLSGIGAATYGGIIHTSSNYILNCNHKNFNQVKLLEIEDFYFDTRLKKQF